MLTCTRRLTFEAGHRVYGHESKCAHLHGHSYKVWITAQGDQDTIGRIVDFSVLKEIFGSWLDKNWDHGTILWKDDPLKHAFGEHEMLIGQKLFLLPTNPTAENLADFLLVLGRTAVQGLGIEITKVVVQETENCTAEASK